MQFAVGDEDVNAPRRIRETLDEVFDGRQEAVCQCRIPRRTKDVLLGLIGGQVADDFDLAAVRADGPVDAGGAAVGVDLAGEVGADFLRHRRDIVVYFFLGAEQRGEKTWFLAADAVQGGHRAGAVQGDAGLSAFLVRFHENGRGDARLAARGGVDVDLAERFNDFF